MKELIAFISTTLLFLGTSLTSVAQDTNSLLWKVSGKELSKPSYLFGTIHLLPAEKYFFTADMQEALDASDVLALEADIDIPLSEQIKMAQQIIIPDGRTWKDFLPETEYMALRSAFVDSLGIKDKKFDKQYTKIKPFFVGALVLTDLLGKVKVYEQELASMAKKSKKPVVGLETVQEQLEIVSTVSVEEQIEELKGTGAGMLRDYHEMLAAYLEQDLLTLGKLATETEGFEKLEAKLLTERNNRWLTSIQEQAAENATFFAVGAMHLVGETGLIQQLQAAGYSVEAVN